MGDESRWLKDYPQNKLYGDESDRDEYMRKTFFKSLRLRLKE